jgi:hypothetical protein
MNRLGAATNALPLRLHRDHLYIDAAAFNTHLPRVHSVALVREADDLLIFPIATAEAGGFLVKQVNARGDRAVHAADFFRIHGIDDAADFKLDAWPNPSIAGFVVNALFKACK